MNNETKLMLWINEEYFFKFFVQNLKSNYDCYTMDNINIYIFVLTNKTNSKKKKLDWLLWIVTSWHLRYITGFNLRIIRHLNEINKNIFSMMNATFFLLSRSCLKIRKTKSIISWSGEFIGLLADEVINEK